MKYFIQKGVLFLL